MKPRTLWLPAHNLILDQYSASRIGVSMGGFMPPPMYVPPPPPGSP